MRIGTVSVGPPLESHWLMTKSSREMAKTTAAEAMIAGVSSGSRTRVRATVGDAPRSAAASSYCLPIEKSRPRTMTTTYEIENVTWPRICENVRARQLEALNERVAQRLVVPHGVDWVTPVPARRESGPHRARARLIER